MEKKIRKIILTEQTDQDLIDIFEYGRITFGERHAQLFLQKVYQKIEELPLLFLAYPECHYLQTKTQIYRNIVIQKYLLIYRIRSTKIEVLRILHGTQSPTKIKAIKKIKTN